jgi:hypothetical protein
VLAMAARAMADVRRVAREENEVMSHSSRVRVPR